MKKTRLVPFFMLLACTFSARTALAEDDVERARAIFLEGTSLVQKAQWAEALGAFERARALRPHPVTTFNMAACERAMGHYTRARALYADALEEHRHAQEDGKTLPASLVTEARAVSGELERLLVRLTLTVQPAGSTVVVDGRPLAAHDRELVAGLRPAGPGEATPDGSFVLVVDPGPHVLMFSRRGFRDATLARTFEPGATAAMTFELSQMPATLGISSKPTGTSVTVNETDVGPTPVAVLRPAGTYRVVVRRTGFVPYETQLSIEPGQEAKVSATLVPEKPSLFGRWWFWTAAGVVIAGAATTTYFLTRPEPTRPAVGGGTLGWTVDVP
ncbi:MAG TPA: PEGA domain-containing protein [Labilithrix sp.]|nr:PEGA domain-containing protein [Labilithrix sp.]